MHVTVDELHHLTRIESVVFSQIDEQTAIACLRRTLLALSTVAALAALTAVIIAGALLWLRPVMYTAFDRDFARSRGIPTRVISYLMAALVAVTIVLSIRIMGIVLLISLVTMPVVIVNSLSRSYRTIAFAAPLVAVAGNVAGLVVSYNFEVPPGAAIIFTLTLTLIMVKLLSLRQKRLPFG